MPDKVEWHSHHRYGAWERKSALRMAKIVRKHHPNARVRIREESPFIHVEATEPYDWRNDNY